jgi:tetratricopeptide (TPR) repeat protein
MIVLPWFLGGSLAIAGQATAPKSGDKSGPELVNEGIAAYQKKDYALAAKLLQEAVAKGATQTGVHYNAACALALAGDNEKAFQFLEKAIQAGYRNPTHLKYDVDFNSLHDDPRWAKIVAACEEALAKFLKERSDPANARFITTDIARFWAAYDKAMSAPAQERAAILQREYIDPGTVGLKDFAASGRVNAKNLAQSIESRQGFFRTIRPLTLALEAQRPSTIAAFGKLKEIYSYATFPDVYFVIGQLGSGGTSSSNGLLMGAEMFSRSPGVPTAELNDWQKGAIMPPSDIAPLVAHESVHFQQKYLWQGGLLCACLIEGGADFVGKLASGRLISRMEETHAWANARERELWEEFRKEMDGKDTSHWLYGSSGGNGRPVDLGYWIGFKISETYYNNAAGKKQALRDMMIVTDCKRFLQNSRYADKFSADDSTPKQ